MDLLVFSVSQAFEDCYLVVVHPSLSEYALAGGPLSPSSSPFRFHSASQTLRANSQRTVMHASSGGFFNTQYTSVAFRSKYLGSQTLQSVADLDPA